MNKSAKLIDDATFRTLHEQQSGYEFQYRTAMPPNKLGRSFAAECTPYLGGCKQFNVNSSVIDDYAKIIPGKAGWSRDGRSASTELLGGPFKARGDGALNNPDALSAAWTPSGGYKAHCNKRLSEMSYDTWSCIGAPLAIEPKEIIGADTRQGLQYITKC